ncbi:exocyst complex component sec6 [Amanita rubescens]|nr:exocyst complex component sec6 [Amanita rubescens]
MSVPQVSAAQAVGEYLQSPDDLAKIVAFKKKLEKEKASIDTRLKNGVKEQLIATREGLRKLLGTRDNVQAIKDQMISRVSMVHRNFQSTQEMVLNLLSMAEKLDDIENMLAADSDSILGPAPSLLIIHYHLNQLGNFRNQTMHEAKKASAASRATLARWFERLNGVIEAFDAYIIELAKNVLNLVRAGHQDVVVRLIKIAELEGKEDEKASTNPIRLVKKAAKMDAASKFKSLQANARVLKHYRSKIMKAIADSIREKFEEAYRLRERDPLGFIGNVQWVYQDLIRIEGDVVPCFPPDYDIYSHYVREYHKSLNSIIKKLAASELEASALLVLFEWLKEYKQSMKDLNIPPELLEPPLLDGQEQQLIEDYLQVIRLSISQNARSRQRLTATGYTGMQGAVILFQMVNQQADSATESGQGAILARVVGEVNRVMRGIQDQWSKLVESELKKQAEKPEEATGGLVEYCIALANDQVKSADFTEALLGRLEQLVSQKYKVPINDRLNDAIDGYLDVAKKCTQTLIDIIFNDLKPATKNLFQAAWYDGTMRQIVETVRDYMADFQSYLNPTLFDLLTEDLLEALLERLRGDIDEIYNAFKIFKLSKEVEQSLEVLELILPLLEASKDIVFLSYWSFAKVHGPNIAFVEGLMKSRSDFDRTAVSEVMESIKRKVKDEGITDPPEPTIMKKVAVQNSFSRFLRT